MAPPPIAVVAEATDTDEVMPTPANPHELSHVPFAGCVTFHFATTAIIHPGVARAIETKLASRRPLLATRGTDLLLSFNIEDDSMRSQQRALRAAERLHEMLPNAVLGEVSIVEVDPGNRPRRTPPRLMDVTGYHSLSE